MTKAFPIYILSGILGLIALYCGFTGKDFWFIKNTRSAVITLFLVGFIMCSSGLIVVFVTKAPAHPLSIIGYVFGLIALIAGIVQIFNLKVPVLSDPKSALIVITIVVIIKIVIARLNFLLPS